MSALENNATILRLLSSGMVNQCKKNKRTLDGRLCISLQDIRMAVHTYSNFIHFHYFWRSTILTRTVILKHWNHTEAFRVNALFNTYASTEIGVSRFLVESLLFTNWSTRMCARQKDSFAKVCIFIITSFSKFHVLTFFLFLSLLSHFILLHYFNLVFDALDWWDLRF